MSRLRDTPPLGLLRTAQDLDDLVVERLRRTLAGPSPLAVVLFGSEARRDSELDLLVVGSGGQDVERRRGSRPQAEAALSRLIGRLGHRLCLNGVVRHSALTGSAARCGPNGVASGEAVRRTPN